MVANNQQSGNNDQVFVLNLDIVVHRRSGSYSIVSDIYRSFDPLHFVLLFPLGTEGWHSKIQQK